MAKKVQDTSPLALGKQQKNSTANKKQKKDEEKKAVAKSTPQSSSVKNTNKKASNSTFMGGGYSTTKKKSSTSSTSSKAKKAADNANERAKSSTFMGGTERPRVAATSREMMEQRKATREANNKQKIQDTIKRDNITMAAAKQAGNKAKDYGKAYAKEQDRIASQRKTEINAFRQTDTGKTIEGELKRTVGGHLKSLGDDGNELSMYKDMLDNGVANGKFTQAEADRAYESFKNSSKRFSRYEGWENTKSHEISQKIFKKGQEIYDEGEQQVNSALEGAGKLKKAYLGALSSGVGMATDMLAGPAWMVSMLSRTYGGEIGRAEKEGATKQEDRNFAGLQALKEVGTEGMFAGIGLAGAMTRGKGLFDAFAGRLTGQVAESGILSALRRYGMGIAEENLEEVAGWALDPAIKNLTYGNALWERQSRQSTRDEGEELRQTIASMDEDSVRAIAAHLNSDAYLDQISDEMMANGATKEEASKMAVAMQGYMNAILSNDKEGEKEYEDLMVSMLKGSNPYKEKLSPSELLETLASTTLLTGVTGIGGAITTAAQGNAIKEANGLDFVKGMADQIKLYDTDNSSQGQAISDHIAEGKDVAGTQVAEIANQFRNVEAERNERYEISNQTKDTLMKREDLRVQPRQQNPDGTYSLGEVTDRAYDEYVKEAIDFMEKSGMDIPQEDMEQIADAYGAYKTGVINPDQMAVINTDNAAARTVLAELGDVNFDNYTVRDNKGVIDTARTNVETENALYAIAADNYVGYARLEQANWNDEARGQVQKAMSERGQFTMSASEKVGGRGDTAMTNALETVDPRDQGKFMLTAKAASNVYNDARYKNAEWDDVKGYYKEMYKGVDQKALQKVFEAAKEDKEIAETENYGKPVSPNMKNSLKDVANVVVPGKVIDMRTDQSVKLSEKSFYYTAATTFGSDITLVDNLPLRDAQGKIVYENVETGERITEDKLVGLSEQEQLMYAPVQVEGSQSSLGITLNTNAGIKRNIEDIIKHEVIHQIRANAPEQFKQLARYLQDKMYSADPEGFMQTIKSKQEQYKDTGDMTVEKAMEEIIAEGGVNLDWDQLIEDIQTNPNIEQKSTFFDALIDAFREVIRKLRAILSSGNVISEEAKAATMDELLRMDEGYKLLVQAAYAAKVDEANTAINEWQDTVNEESRYSVDEAEVERIKAKKRTNAKDREILRDAGEKLKENDFYSLYSAHKLDLRRNGNVAEQVASIKTNGFYGDAGFGHNVVPSSINNISRQTADERRASLKEAGLSDEQIEDSIKRLRENPGSGFWSEDTYFPAANATEIRYGGRKGETVMFVPEHHVYRGERVFNGFKPFDYEVVEVERDFQPYYELYSKAYDEAHERETRYSIAETEELNDAGLQTLEGGSVARYSLTSLKEEKKDKVRKALHQTGAFTDEQIDKWIADIWSIAAIVEDNRERLDYWADRSVSSKKSNSDYKYSFDFSTLCPKRTYYQGTLNAIYKVMPGAILFPDDLIHVRKLLKDAGYQSPCGFCYVESERKWLDQKVGEFLKQYKGEYIPKPTELTATDSNIKTEHPEAWNAWLKYRGKLGQGGPRLVDPRTDYRGEILRMSQATIDELNSIGGLRFQSYSDFEVYHMLDMMQAIRDAAARGLKVQMYTKIPVCAEIFGSTGIKINLSLVAKTNPDGSFVKDENGNLVFDDEEGMPYEDAKRLREMYPENVGTILVGHSREHIIEAMADDRVDFIIPFHQSGWSMKEFAELGLKGYEDISSTFSKSYEVDLKTGKKADKELYSGDYWEDKDGTWNAKKYLNICKENGVAPMFSDLLQDNGDGSWSLKEDGSTDGYWKLLIDGKMYDNDGKRAEQQPVKPEFNMEAANRLLNETIKTEGNANTLPVAQDVVEQFVKEFVADHPDTEVKDVRMSISAKLDDDYMDAVNSGNMDEAQRLVDEAAKMAGFDTPLLHHGTPSFGFTTFDLARGENIIFATNSRLTAETYSGETSRNRISEKSKVDIDQLYGQELLDKAKQHLSRYKDYRLMSGSEKEDSLDEARSDMASIANDVVAGFIAEHRDAFDEEKLGIANRIVDSLNKISTAWNDDDVQTAWDDFQDAIWDLKWADESIQLELSREIQSGGALQFLKNRISDFMYAGDLYARGDSTSQYVYDNQLALELGAELNKGIYGLYGNPGKQLVIDANGSNWNQIIPPDDLGLYGPQRTRSIAEAAKAKGYDSVLFKDLRDNGGATAYNGESDVYMFFNPNQVKSADPVTYAEDGSVIPLSERFDPTNNDIRYSLPTQDSDGKILTDGQMEYFKNSQARDIFGRLVPVYHTTNYGGFTIFDPSYSDDKRSLFFASNWDVSQTYGYKAKAPINLSPSNRIYATWAEVENDIKNRFPEWIEEENMVSPFLPPETIKTSEALNAFVFHKNDHTYADELGIEEGFDKWVEMSENGEDTSDYYVMLTVPKAQGSVDIRADSLAELLTKLANELDTGQGKQRGYYSCYLNLENPLIVDAQNQSWNNIPYGEYSEDAVLAIKNLTVQDMGDGIYVNIWGDRKVDGKWQEFRESDTIEFEYLTVDGEYEIPERAWDEVYDFLVKQGLSSDYAYEHSDAFFDFNGLDTFDKDGRKVESDVRRYRTRELAALADAKGYDSVIIRNCYDIGAASHLKGEGLSDIYIAFSSNQVKDINNENPTENPDIRYSVVDDDEAKSQIAYDDAMDDSYELLAYYEQQLGRVDPETFDVTKAFKEEDVVRFLDALKAEDAVPSNDAYFEEDRVRRAKSKEEFFNSVNARWNDRWITEGEVLNIQSVRKDITNLVKGAMANSNTDAQYRNEIVRKTLLDARLAYQLMKQDRTELASYLLYHSAQRMMDGLEFIKDDTAFAEYKGIRDYLRQYRINVPDKYWQNESFLDFRKEYYGRLRIGKGNNNIESVYKDLANEWPHIFNESQREKADCKSDPEGLLQHIGAVVDSNVTPFYEAYSSEEATSLAYELADELYDIIANGDRVVSLADSYKERFDVRTKAMKQRHVEALLRERKIREEGIRKERIKFREYKERQKEKALHTKHFESIKGTYDELTKRLLTNTKEKHIPEQYKKELAELLKAFDFQTVGSKKREARTGYKAQKTIKMEAMRTALERIEVNSKLFHVNDSVTDIMKDLLGLDDYNSHQSIEGKTLDELSAAELKKVDNLLKSLLHEFNNYEKVKVGVKKRQAADIGHAQNDISLEHANALGAGIDYQTPMLQSMDRIINLDMMTPAYLFRKIDPNNEGLGLMWKEIRRSFDKYVRNTNQLNEWIEDIVGEYHEKGILWNKYGSGELSNWRSINYARTFNLTYGPLELTPAQMMSVYCLSKRKQAYDHMIGAGVVASPVSFQAKIMSDVKKKVNKSLSLKLTDADIKTIITALTPEQINVANKLQELMATKMAAWGNEASMNVLGIELFNDPDYFPIRSDKAGLTKDLDPNQFEQAIRNFGFTKAVQPGARNAIMIDDIFDVVTEHCNNMNLYNSYTEAMNDFMKVYNYRDVRDEGEYTVEQALRHAFSDKTPMFIMQFMRDLNGNVSGRPSGIESMYNALLANAKKASVFANFRVAAQQPTAISRAFYVIDSKYIKGIKVDKDAMTEMFEHCPIALWKSWGYYDINMGKSIEDVIMNNGRWLEDKATDLYGALDNVTWTAIWQMVKAEMKDTHPDVKPGTDEYWDLCNERMSEIVDLTQVVDSPMHRSHAMRDKGFFKKMTTAFMAEPTLTANMLRDGMERTSEAYKRGNLKLAGTILLRTLSVYLLQSVMVAGAQSFVDALRHKMPDKDDDDDRFLHLWWVNFVEDWKDEWKPLGKIYVIKDIKSMMEGWENRNLALQGVYYLSLGYRQLQGDPYARSSNSWYENILYGFGYLSGIPIKTMMTGLSNAMETIGIESPALKEYGEQLDNLAKKKDESDVDATSAIGKLFRLNDIRLLKKTDDETAEDYEEYDIDNLPDNLTDEQKEEIRKAGEKHQKNAEKKEADRDVNQMLFDAEKAAAGYEGAERDKRIWSSVSKGYKEHIEQGDFAYIAKMRHAVEEAGGDLEYFDERIMAAAKTQMKKTIEPGGADTEAEMVAQQNIKKYLLGHGMTQEELSSEIVYKSKAAKDLKVAFRINDNQAIVESTYVLMWAGITQEDINRLYENRNKMDLKKYDGRYKDRLKSTGTFIWPTNGTVTSEFGYRTAPTAGASSNHPSIDIGAPQGTPVGAADGGTVIYAGWNSGYGNSVGIKHDNGMVTYYNHLYDYNVKVGDTVAQGQQVGQVGSTGISTGPHLDFKILDVDGNPVNPRKYLGY